MTATAPPSLDAVLARLRDALEARDFTGAVTIIEALHPFDQAELMDGLEKEDQVALLPALQPAQSADILEELEDEEAAALVAALPTATVIRIVDEMEPDTAADLLGDMAPSQARAVLAGLEDPDEIRPLLLHPDTTAGGLMTSEYLALRRQMTVEDAVRAIRAWLPKREDIYSLFVVDRAGRLAGVVSLRQLLTASPGTRLMDLMDPRVISVAAATDQETCARVMSNYDLLSLPVVDDTNVLIGVITIDDVVDVLEDEATEDIQRLGGSEPLDSPYLLTSVLSIARKRVGWLLLLFVTESLTGSVLRFFEGELKSVVALTFFIPLLIGTGGNAGSQATSTIIRALAVGDVRLREAFHTFWHELRVGIILAIIMGLVAFGRAMLWGSGGSLALAVSLAIAIIVIWANGLGALLPLTAAAIGIDPTVVSGPAMSTLVDATGLFIYFSIAHAILGL